MREKAKRPGPALARTSGADLENTGQCTIQGPTYPETVELQIRHIRSRCGVTGSHARLLAALCFGEDGK